jgi:hypothetical protein
MGINKWHKVDEITHQKNISCLSIKSENYSSNQNSDLVVVIPVNEFSSLSECNTLPLPSSNKKTLTVSSCEVRESYRVALPQE